MIRWLALLLTSFILTGPAFGADLDGTLKKIKSINTITSATASPRDRFRSWATTASRRGTQWTLCTRIAESVGARSGLPALQVKWVKVTVENRMRSVVNGTIDLECGSTTASLSRQEQVDFSLLTFIDGGSLLVTDASRIRGISTLGDKRVAIIPGTTTEGRA